MCPSPFYYKLPSISLTPFSLIPQFPALPPFLSCFTCFSPYHFLPHTPLPLPSVLLVLQTSCIRQGGKAPLTAQHLVCFISHIIPLIIFCTPPSISLSLFLSPAAVLNISQLSSSLSFTLHLLPYLHHRYHILLIFLSPPSSLLFIEGCL